MFEKEAEEYTVENVCSSCYFEKPCENKCEAFGCADSKTYVLKAFKDGAEFGYNKANEWHYVKDGDLPKENKLYFVAIKDNGLAIAYFNGLHWETRYNLGDFGHCVETVIAWKELPELPKESE